MASKAEQAKQKLLDGVRARADQKAQEAPREPGQGDPEPKAPLHDERGLFRAGHEKVGGRKAGTPNRIPRSIKEVMLKLAEGTLFLEADQEAFSQKAARLIADGMDGKLIASKIDGRWGISTRYEPRLGYLLAFLKYGLERADKLGTGTGARSGPKIVFMGQAHDPMAKPGAPPEPLRMLGQVRRADGVIVDFKTGQPVGPPKAPTPVVAQEPPPEDDEVLDDPIPPNYEERGPRAC